MSVQANVQELNSMILSGDILGAFEKFYADDVVMQEGNDDPRVGKDANREYEKNFVNSLTDFRGADVKNVAVNEEDGVAMVQWWMDFTHKDWGDVELNQVSVQQWHDGKIVNERFYSLN